MAKTEAVAKDFETSLNGSLMESKIHESDIQSTKNLVPTFLCLSFPWLSTWLDAESN